MSFELTLPQLGLTMTEGVIVEWLKKEGDEIAVGDVVFSVENDKSVVEYEAAQAGTLAKILVEDGVMIPIKTAVALVAEPGEDVSEVAATASDVVPEAAAGTEAAAKTVEKPSKPAETSGTTGVIPATTDGFVLASPRARALAEERGIDLAGLSGSGPDGVVIEQDIPSIGDRTGFAGYGGPASRKDQEITLSRIQAVAAERLAKGWQQIPQFTIYQDAPMSALAGWRTAINETRGYKPSMSVLIAKAVAAALARHERLNAHWLGNNRIKAFGEVNIGIAMDTPNGLVVPVLGRCLTSSVEHLDQEWRALTERVKNGKTTSDDFAGAGFTISNLGMFGTDRFRALVNPPQVGILSIGAQKDIVFQNISGAIVSETRATIGLSADHRAVDGAYAARFLNDVVTIVANPALIYEVG